MNVSTLCHDAAAIRARPAVGCGLCGRCGTRRAWMGIVSRVASDRHDHNTAGDQQCSNAPALAGSSNYSGVFSATRASSSALSGGWDGVRLYTSKLPRWRALVQEWAARGRRASIASCRCAEATAAVQPRAVMRARGRCKPLGISPPAHAAGLHTRSASERTHALVEGATRAWSKMSGW